MSDAGSVRADGPGAPAAPDEPTATGPSGADTPGHREGTGDPAAVATTAAAGEPAAGARRRPGRRPTVRIGLTGPIGCGKSTVGRWLAALGAGVIDADVLARAATAPGEPAHDAILARFGPDVAAPDGTLDRAALARLAFTDPVALGDLEAIVHPAVRPRILAAIEAAEAVGVPAVVVEAIRLVEGGLAALCDEVWLVTCEPPTQRERLLGRGMAAADADRRIAAQADLEARVRPVATRVIDTSGLPEETAGLVAEALERALGTRLA